jgi:hypothetical protein
VGNRPLLSRKGLRMADDEDDASNKKAQTEALAERDQVWRNSLDILVVADAEGCSGR